MSQHLKVASSTWASRRYSLVVLLALAILGISLSPTAWGQSNQGLKPRKLAPDVLTIVPANPQPEETSLGPIDLDVVRSHPELEWTAPDFPNNAPYFSALSDTLLASSRGTILRHSVYAFEFAFKPVRTIEVAVPSSAGSTKKLVWYLVYRIRYLGNDLQPEFSSAEGSVKVPTEPKRVISDAALFVPRFTLLAEKRTRQYTEKILPAAISAISERERIGKPLLDSVEMMRKIPKSTEDSNQEFWGVATWTDIDPKTDYFAVHVEGLTNAYRIVGQGEEQRMEKKVLQIHFWRPGDTIDEPQDLIRLGVPAFEQPERVQNALSHFGLKERLDYLWVYR